MPEITVTTTVTFDPERFYDMSDFVWASAWLSSGMFKSAGELDAPTTGVVIPAWVDPNDYGKGSVKHEVTWQQLGEGIAHIAAGTFTNYDGTEREPRDYHVAAANAIMRDFDNADWDSETEDLILQQAVFGKVIYG